MRTNLVLIPLIIACGASQGQAPINLLSSCSPNSVCVPMTVDVLSPSAVKVVQPQDSLGYTTFEVQLQGRFVGQARADQVVRVRGYTDGMQCSSFGQAQVAVVGHSATNHPVILTDRGPLELTDSVLEVGCPDCAKILDERGHMIATRRTPGWDLALAGTRAKALSVNSKGELILQSPDGFIQLTVGGLFKRVNAPTPSKKYRLELKDGACT